LRLIGGQTYATPTGRSNKDVYARFTGTDPIPVWSGSSGGTVRLNRGDDRSINTALPMIAVPHSRGYRPDRAYLGRRDRGWTRAGYP